MAPPMGSHLCLRPFATGPGARVAGETSEFFSEYRTPIDSELVSLVLPSLLVFLQTCLCMIWIMTGLAGCGPCSSDGCVWTWCMYACRVVSCHAMDVCVAGHVFCMPCVCFHLSSSPFLSYSLILLLHTARRRKRQSSEREEKERDTKYPQRKRRERVSLEKDERSFRGVVSAFPADPWDGPFAGGFVPGVDLVGHVGIVHGW